MTGAVKSAQHSWEEGAFSGVGMGALWEEQNVARQRGKQYRPWELQEQNAGGRTGARKSQEPYLAE